MLPTSSAEDTLLRRGKWTYICALLVIGALSLGSHLVIASIIHRQVDNSARLVNLCGRQRMLSQRIVKIALERALHRIREGDPTAQRSLRESIDRMATIHDGLLNGSAKLHLSPPPPSVREIYTGSRWNVDAKVQRFLAHARVLADEPAAKVSLDDPDLLEIEDEARAPLLDALDAAVVADLENSERAIGHLRMLLGLFTVLMLLILLAEAFLLFRPLFQQLARQQERLLAISRIDPLTGCFNRRAFEDLAPAAIDRARRANEQLSLLSFDLDHFKSVNDTHGHAVGDLVLQSFAATIAEHIRKSDALCRVGGEEFVLLLPHTSAADIGAVARRFCERVERVPVPVGTTQLRVTVSIGATTLHASDATIQDLLARADLALYEAKRAGRNRVELALVPMGPPPTVPGGTGSEPLAGLPNPNLA